MKQKSKKLLALILASLMVVSMAACKKDENTDDPETTPDDQTAAPTATEAVFATDGKSDYSIVYTASTLTTNEEDAVLAFRMALRRQFSNSDFSIDKWGNKEAESKDAKELLIGETSREVSQGLKAAVPEGCFGIEVTGNKVAIYAGDERLTKYAIEYFKTNYIPDDGSKNVKLTVGRYVSDVIDFNIKSIISSTPGFSTQHSLVYNIPATDSNKIMQGGCSDGSYMYFCMVNGGSGTQKAYVYKYDIKTNKLVKKSELLDTDHSNDMTYNSKTNEIIILHNAPRRYMLTVIDPETLTVKRIERLSFNMFCIDYNEEHDAYVVGLSGGQNFTILTSDFQVDRRFIPAGKGKFEVESTGYTTQGVVCDDKYVYFVQYKLNVIMVYDWNGNFINKITLSIPSDIEPENISIIGDTFYIGCNNSSWSGGILYKVSLIAPV